MIVELFSNGLVANINYYAVVQAENIQLLSFRGRRRRKSFASGRPLSRRSCSIDKKYIRTIICIPQEHVKFVDVGNNMAISIPPRPSLEFSSRNNFPTANTCANVITIPLVVGWQYERFEKAINFAILNSPGFGVA